MEPQDIPFEQLADRLQIENVLQDVVFHDTVYTVSNEHGTKLAVLMPVKMYEDLIAWAKEGGANEV
jgi:hypothetical protein